MVFVWDGSAGMSTCCPPTPVLAGGHAVPSLPALFYAGLARRREDDGMFSEGAMRVLVSVIRWYGLLAAKLRHRSAKGMKGFGTVSPSNFSRSTDSGASGGMVRHQRRVVRWKWGADPSVELERDRMNEIS
jgi:hypothetical protein